MTSRRESDTASTELQTLGSRDQAPTCQYTSPEHFEGVPTLSTGHVTGQCVSHVLANRNVVRRRLLLTHQGQDAEQEDS
jgi:hypothetical protein